MTERPWLDVCPLCGGEAAYQEVGQVRGPWWPAGMDALGVTVVCRECGCTIPSFMDEERAAERWNLRVTRRAKPCRMELVFPGGLWRCSECGKRVYGLNVGDGIGTAPRFCPSCGARRTENYVEL